MAICFLCDSKLSSENAIVCSSITPHSLTPYPEKIAGILGEEFLVIVTPNDQLCHECTSLMNYLDKCENDARLVTNLLILNIQKKFGTFPPDQAVKNVEVIDEHLMTGEQQEQDQSKVPDNVPIVFPTTTTAAVVTEIQTPLKLSKTQQQNLPQQHQLQQQSPYPQQQQEGSRKIKTFKCRFCGFHSKDLGKVRFHLSTHANKNDAKKLIPNKAAAETITTVLPQKKILFKCSSCSESFDNQLNCADHMRKDHYQPIPSTSNIKREKDDEDREMPEQEEVGYKTLGNIKKEVYEDH